jgi:hypothetical protein
LIDVNIEEVCPIALSNYLSNLLAERILQAREDRTVPTDSRGRIWPRLVFIVST